MLVTSLALLVAVAGCAGPTSRAPETPPTPAAVEATPPPPVPTDAVAPRPADWSGPVPVARLVQAAHAAHPTVAAIAATRSAAAALVRQAGAWDNPELEMNLGRTRPRLDDLERDMPYGGSLSQRLMWWGKRNARLAAARAQQNAAEAEAQMSLLGLHAEVRRAAIAYATAIATAAQADEEARIANELATMTQTRLAAGAVDQASASRAKLEATTASLHRDARRREAATALAVLRTWCDPALPDGLVIADAFAIGTPATDAASLARVAEGHPQLRALAEAAAAAQATVEAERQARIPDLTVGVFAGHEDEKDTYGVTLGVALPVWHRNDAGIAAAEAARAQAGAAIRSERLRLSRDLAEALGIVQTAHGQAQALAEQAVPIAEETIRLRTTAYQAGEASLSDLLEARRAANAVRTELHDARRRAALAAVDLGLAVGDPSLGTTPKEAAQP